MIDFNSIEALKKNGFKGFKSVEELNLNPQLLPNQKGVYLVLNISDKKTEFLEKGVGGFFKGKDPNLPIAELKRNWVEDCKTIYIGKAGGLSSNATLRSRLKQYLKFGQGKNVGHYGGRLIWQLDHHLNLIFCWLPIEDSEPRDLEKKLLVDFIQQFGQRPYANLTG
ncbi:hypothetical protein LB465_12525 [Salegentibacter sp. LM13S]|uniref:hypothetical protein n=1 Tax=Salegentibacter lacus TaxID=2873599 RepID=UPI001CCD779A|nr:hypothetical protein [Salegentibacter lacus]MBZ9631607.1 hypothetical protein [Salegentibacter lacus]